MFLLTTDSTMITAAATAATASTSGSATPADLAESFELEINQHAYQRYFDRPDVIKACREQENIQTPDFQQIPDHASVGGRFRPRTHTDDVRPFTAPYLRSCTYHSRDFLRNLSYVLSSSFYRNLPTLQMKFTKSGIASTRHSKNASGYARRRN